MLTARQARDLGNGLRRLRVRKQLTRYQAAEICGLPHLVYARLEAGTVPLHSYEPVLARAWGALQAYAAAQRA